MRGLFIPDITAEMFKNGCLESIEALMAEGEVYDIDYSPWIPVSERLPEEETDVLVCCETGAITVCCGSYSTEVSDTFIWYIEGWRFGKVIAWMPLPEPYKAESEVEEK